MDNIAGTRPALFWVVNLSVIALVLIWLIPVSLVLGGLGLAAFFWALRSNQFDACRGSVVQGRTRPALEIDGRPEVAPEVGELFGDVVQGGGAVHIGLARPQ